MVIKILDYLTEFFLFVLAVGMTVSNAPCEVASYFIIFLFLVKRIILKKFRPPASPVNIFLYLYFIVVFITFLRSSYFKESLYGFLRLPKYIFLYFALIEFFSNDKKRINRFFWMLMITATITFINGIFQSFFGFDFFRHKVVNQEDYLHRIMASFVDPNDFGAYIISILPLTFTFLSKELSRKKRITLVVFCLLAAFCLFKTFSRGAWIGFFVGATVYFFIYNKKSVWLIPLIIIIFLITPLGFNRVASLFKPEKNTVWERTQLWQTAGNMIKEHPFLGLGVNTFAKYFPKYKPVDYPDMRYAHNSYLQMWSEVGIIGLLVFICIIVRVLTKALKGIRRKFNAGPEGFILMGAIAGYLGLLVHSFFDNNLFSLMLTTLFWVFTAYIVSLDKYFTEKTNA